MSILKKKWIYILSTVCLAATSCSNGEEDKTEYTVPQFKNIELPDATRAMVGNENAFAIKLTDALTDHLGNENFAVSPYVILNIMGITAHADEPGGKVQQEILSALEIDSQDMGALSNLCSTLNNQLPTLDPSVTLLNANALWHKEEDTINPSLLPVLTETFGLEDRTANLLTVEGMEVVNNWISAKTNGIIPKLFEQPFNDDKSILSVLYFQGLWKHRFDATITKSGTFYNATGKTQEVPFMNQTETMRYARTEALEAVEMDFGSGNFAMTVIKGIENAEIPELTLSEYSLLMQSMGVCQVTLSLPKFSVFSTLEMHLRTFDCLGMNELAEKGIKTMFEQSPYQPSILFQGIQISIDEEGATAAAVGGTDVIISPGYAEVTFDTPFIYVIREVSTGSILFIGRQNNF